jgi:hypothetical protein
MELTIDPETAERIAWGVLSFIALIAWCRWAPAPRRIKREPTPPEMPERRERQTENGEINPPDFD